MPLLYPSAEPGSEVDYQPALSLLFFSAPGRGSSGAPQMVSASVSIIISD
jgi:hypothetical protein